MMENALEDLTLAENEVLEILKIAEETLNELQRLPQCDPGKLSELSTKYMNLIKSVYSRLSAHSSIMKNTVEDSSSEIYSVKKKEEIFESLQLLSAPPDTTDMTSMHNAW